MSSVPVRKADISFPLGAYVRAEREQQGLTQSDLAERMGVSRSAVQKVEAVTTGSVHLGTVLRAAQALGLDLAAMVNAVVIRGMKK
jgi:transcriptional regulator with XRE-family HTH domain